MWRNKPAAPARVTEDLPDSEIVAGLQAMEPGRAESIVMGLRIVGEIRAGQDLSIAGEVTGSVSLPDSELLVERTANIHANIVARIIEVQGNVAGDLKASERIVIRSCSTVKGDAIAPQIQLEEGCRFKGSVQVCEPDVKHSPPAKPRLVGGPGAVRRKAANA